MRSRTDFKVYTIKNKRTKDYEKNNLLALCLLGTALNTSAQLKVANDGKVYVQRSVADGHADLGVGESPYIDYDLHDSDSIGIFVHKNNSSLYKSCLGVFSEARNTSGFTAGVWGEASGGTENIGVMGVIPPLTSGAGIFGTDEGGPAPLFSGIYGGYIYDDLYVDGQVITTCGFYNTSDMRLKENVTLMSDKEEVDGASALDKLQRLEVLEYNLKRPSQVRSDEEGNKREMTEKAKALAGKRHFGISAQELQTVYPQLVEESQEGYLMVNYVELVPVLIRSIQELKAELDGLKGNDGAGVGGDLQSLLPARSQRHTLKDKGRALPEHPQPLHRPNGDTLLPAR